MYLVLLLCVLLSYFPTGPSAPLFPKAAVPTRSGYLPISNTSSSALFFAFYEAQHPVSASIDSTPLVIWLQGGPGCSSMVGNFFELGPWLVTDQLTLRPNPYTWNRRFGLLFIDNPIGVGFSVAASPREIPRDQTTVAKHLWFALQSFLSSSGPSFRPRPLYITGESYAGKYVPSFGFHVLRENLLLPRAHGINLRGVAIGDGLTHPVGQVTAHAACAYFSGLINERQRAHLERLQQKAVRLTLRGRWSEATDARNEALSWLQNVTGLATLLDLRRTRPYGNGMVNVFLRKEAAAAALGAAKGVVWRACNGAVEAALHGDVMKSAKWTVEGLLRGQVKVLLYEGEFDLRDGVASAEAWVREMDGWEGLARFLAAERRVWEVRGELAGYVQRWGPLSHVVVSGAGHMVPADQGLSSQAMIEGWVLGQGLFREDE